MGKGQHLGEFEQLVLIALLHLDDRAYGGPIRDLIEERTGRRVAIATVYAALDRMERKGWATYSLSSPKPVQGGRSKKIFRATEDGLGALHRSRRMLAQMLDGLDTGAGTLE